MERGWSAAGLLRPLWNAYPGGRDALAEKIGTKGTVLSSINTGDRRLGINLGQRLAEELGVGLAELGCPADLAVDRRSLPLLLRLEEAETALEQLGPELKRLGDRVTALEQAGPSRRTGES